MDPSHVSLIRTEKLTKRFGGFVAVDHVDFVINRNETIGIIGTQWSWKNDLS